MNSMKLAVAAALLSSSAIAPAHEGHGDRADGKHGVKETIIIKRVHGAPGKGHSDHAMIAKCEGAPEVDVSDDRKEGDKVKRSRVIICNKGANGVDVAAALEKARDRIAGQDELSAETKSKALAAIDAAIARHRGK